MYYLNMFTSWETFLHLVWEKYTYNKTRYFVPLLDKRCNQKQYRRRPPPIKNHRIKWHVGVVHQHKVWIRHNDLIQINHSLYCTHSFQFWHVQNLSLLYVNRANQNKLSFLFKKRGKPSLILKTWRKIRIDLILLIQVDALFILLCILSIRVLSAHLYSISNSQYSYITMKELKRMSIDGR